MSARFYLIPLVIVAAGAAWLVNARGGDQAKSGSITVEVPRIESEWCKDGERSRRGWYCEVREFTLDATGMIELDASPNGSIEVAGWDGDRIAVLAKVEGRARSDEAAHALVSAVTFSFGAELKASGPKNQRNESWSVSYRAKAPYESDLTLKAMNGSVAIQGVSGVLELNTMNGSVTLGDVSGDVTARTINGGIKASLSGSTWDGSGLELRTTNGAVEIQIPGSYNAALEAATTNGGIQVDFPVTVTGRISKKLSTVLGDGGPTITATTTNGAVKIRKH